MDDPKTDTEKSEDRASEKTRDALRPHNMQGDTARKNEESAKRGTENTKDTLRPENMRADRNK